MWSGNSGPWLLFWPCWGHDWTFPMAGWMEGEHGATFHMNKSSFYTRVSSAWVLGMLSLWSPWKSLLSTNNKSSHFRKVLSVQSLLMPTHRPSAFFQMDSNYPKKIVGFWSKIPSASAVTHLHGPASKGSEGHPYLPLTVSSPWSAGSNGTSCTEQPGPVLGLSQTSSFWDNSVDRSK